MMTRVPGHVGHQTLDMIRNWAQSQAWVSRLCGGALEQRTRQDRAWHGQVGPEDNTADGWPWHMVI